MALFDYPRNAFVGRVVPKHRVYAHAGASARLRERFVEQVEGIVWRFKLAPETLNLHATRAVPEIQVFEVELRNGELDEDVLRALDRAIPFPLVFELAHDGHRRATAAYKRPSEADAARWVTSEYFAAAWVADDVPRVPLPVALDLGALYDRILAAMMPVAPRPGEDLEARVGRVEAIRAQTRLIERIRTRLGREKQFNRRVAINGELRAALFALERLTGADETRQA